MRLSLAVLAVSTIVLLGCGDSEGDGDVADCADLEQRFETASQSQRGVWLSQATEADCLWALDLAAEGAEIQAEQQQQADELSRQQDCQLAANSKEQLAPITARMRARADEMEAQGMSDLAENTRRQADAYEAVPDAVLQNCPD